MAVVAMGAPTLGFVGLLSAALVGCLGSEPAARLAVPPDVTQVVVLELDGEVVTQLFGPEPVVLGLGPRRDRWPAEATLGVLGWRTADGLPEGLEDLRVASDPTAPRLPAPSYAARGPSEALAPWPSPPSLTAEGLPPCPTPAPEGSTAHVTCGARSCRAEVRVRGCRLDISAAACGLVDTAVELDARGAPEGSGCAAAATSVPGARLALTCEVEATTCRVEIVPPAPPARLRVLRKQAFEPPGDDWPEDAVGRGWLPPPTPSGDRVLVVERSTPSPERLDPARPARLHLLDADSGELVRTTTAAAGTWAAREDGEGGFVTFEAGTTPRLVWWTPDLTAARRLALEDLAGPLRFPSAADRAGARLVVVWSEVGAQPGLAWISTVDADGPPRRAQLDTPEVSAVALRPDGRFIALDDEDDRVSLYRVDDGGREDSYRLGITSRPLRALVHHPERFETWIASGGAVQPEVSVTGPGGFMASPRAATVHELEGEPWALAEWPAAPGRGLVGVVTRSGAGRAFLGLFDPDPEHFGLLGGLTDVGAGPVVGGVPDDAGRVWLGLPADGAVLRVEPW